METKWQDWVNLLLGLWVAVSPWIVTHVMAPEGAAAGAYPGVVTEAAMWNFILVGIAIVLVAWGALAAFQRWEEWTNLVLGIWLLLSPWVLDYTEASSLTWNAVIAGAAIIVFAAWALMPGAGSKSAS